MLKEYNIPKDGLVVDVGAGTGASANALKAGGYNNIVALEPSSELRKFAE